MAKLLHCQEQEVLIETNTKELKEFATELLRYLLDVTEQDLSAQENMDIDNFCLDWSKR